MCIPDGGDGPLCGDCLLLWMEGAPAVGRDKTDSSETDSSGPPSLVDSSSGEDVPHDPEPEAESDTLSESSREELT